MDTGLTVLDLVDDLFFLVVAKDCRLLFCHHEAMVLLRCPRPQTLRVLSCQWFDHWEALLQMCCFWSFDASQQFQCRLTTPPWRLWVFCPLGWNLRMNQSFRWGKYHINFYDASSLAKLPMVIDEFIPCRMPDKKPVPMFARRQLKDFCHQLSPTLKTRGIFWVWFRHLRLVFSMKSSIQRTSLVPIYHLWVVLILTLLLFGKRWIPITCLLNACFFGVKEVLEKFFKVWTEGGVPFSPIATLSPHPFCWTNNHAGSKVTWYTWFYHSIFVI